MDLHQPIDLSINEHSRGLFHRDPRIRLANSFPWRRRCVPFSLSGLLLRLIDIAEPQLEQELALADLHRPLLEDPTEMLDGLDRQGCVEGPGVYGAD